MTSTLTLFSANKTWNINGANPAQIFHITDMEGGASFFNFINKSNIVTYDPEHGIEFNKTCKNPYFIYGGDVTDHGSFDLAITKSLIDFKKRYPERVFLIAGNREITKNRFRIELAPEFIRERLMHSKPPRWLVKEMQTVPLDYVIEDMRRHNIASNSQDMETIQKYVNALSIQECQLIYLHWMLEKTMGCPDTFQCRREELAKNATVVTDADVLNSILKESSPEGLTGQYLQLAQIAAIVPNTGVLAMHGGLNPYNIGRIPDMPANDKSIDNARVWIKQYNNWFRNQVNDWIDYKTTHLTDPAFTKLDDVSLPLHNVPKSIMVADILDKDKQYSDVSPIVSEYLRKNNIQIVLTGHQQCGDHPAIVRAENTVFINGDTGHDPRGDACHVIEIEATSRRAHASIRGTLSDKTSVNTQMTITADKISGDPYIGRVLPDHRLVQCRLANGDYRLLQIKNRQAVNSIVSQSEVEQCFNVMTHCIEM